MSLILLSESLNNNNEELITMIRSKIADSATIAYIPSKYDPQQLNFQKFVSGFMESIGVENNQIKHFEIENDLWSDDYLNEIPEKDILFLPGGNTYRFVYWLKYRGLGDIIDHFAKNKLIIGISAGSIAMTPRIDIARDEALTGMDNSHDGFDIVNFYLKPHYRFNEIDNKYISNYLEELPPDEKKPVYAIGDGAGVFVDGDEISVEGEYKLFDHFNLKI